MEILKHIGVRLSQSRSGPGFVPMIDSPGDPQEKCLHHTQYNHPYL
jgi:hypothetical protein